jgi:hypothetical protein
MSKSESLLGGLGALAFGVLGFAGMVIAQPPGGSYDESQIADFIAAGHRPWVFAGMYATLAAAAGLLLLLARLRSTIADDRRRTIFWGFGVAAVAAWVAGFAIVAAPSYAIAFSGGDLKTLPGTLVYTVSEAGWGVMYGGGGLLLGCALAAFVIGRVTVPAWVRAATGIAAVASLAAIAWFPFFVVFAWSIVMGVWSLVTGSRALAAADSVPAPG